MGKGNRLKDEVREVREKDVCRHKNRTIVGNGELNTRRHKASRQNRNTVGTDPDCVCETTWVYVNARCENGLA